MTTPKLRFKEFDGDWAESKLQDCIDSIDSGWSPQCESYPADENEWAVLKTTSVDWDGFKANFNKKLPSNLEARFEIEVKPSDILVTRAGPTERVGVVAVVPQTVRSKLMISDKLIRLKANHDNNPEFLGISLSSAKCQNQLQSKTSGLAKSQTNISQKILSDVSLMTPAKEEQTKIATFLSAVNEKISQLTQKHELLSQYKQGMMQKLFSQQIRFKADDGGEFGEWDYLELNEVLDYEQPTKYIVKSTDYDSSYLTPVLTAGKTFILGYTNETSGIFEGDKENVIIFDDFTTAYKFVNFRFKVKSSAMKILKLNHFQNNIFYIYSVFSLLNLPLGDEHKRRWISEYSKQEIPVPCLEEQTQIANFLSAIDQKIEVVAQQIQHAKLWKKGLLQQMFV